MRSQHSSPAHQNNIYSTHILFLQHIKISVFNAISVFNLQRRQSGSLQNLQRSLFNTAYNHSSTAGLHAGSNLSNAAIIYISQQHISHNILQVIYIIYQSFLSQRSLLHAAYSISIFSSKYTAFFSLQTTYNTAFFSLQRRLSIQASASTYISVTIPRWAP